MLHKRSVIAAAVIPVLALVATVVAVAGAPPPAVAAVPEDCDFPTTARSWHKNVDRFTVCTSFPFEWIGVDTRTGNQNGRMLGRFDQWYKLDGKSLTVERSFRISALAGSASGTMLPGVDIEITNPCLVEVPYGCTSDEPARLVYWRALVAGMSFTKTFSETFHLPTPSTSIVPRGVLRDALVIQSRPVSPGAMPIPAQTEPVDGYDFWCDAIKGGSWAGCVNREVDPGITFDATKNPLLRPVAHHIAAAQSRLPGSPGGKDAAFELIDNQSEIAANRNRHCDGNAAFQYDKPRNDACDDFPFAMVKQTGVTPFSVMPVPATAEAARDATLTSFILDNHLFAGDKFTVGTKLDDAKEGSVAPYSALNNQFNAYSNNASCEDWSGGDATNSIRLPNGQRAWFFSDSFLGSPPSRRNFFGFSSLHNSIVMQNGTSMRTITGGNTCQEGNLSKEFWDRYAKTIADAPDQGGFYWTGDQQLVDGDTVVKFYYHGRPSGDLWVNDYSAVARIPVSQFANSVMTVTPTPMRCSTDPKVLWGTMTMRWSDGNYYIYGTGAIAPQRIYLARASAANLSSFANWQFLSSVDTRAGTAGWSSSCAAAAPLPIGVATGGSVSYVNGAVWLIQNPTRTAADPAGAAIKAHPSATPWGFSSRNIRLYTPPEAHHDFPYYYQVYEPRLQAGLTAGSDLVLSYNVNTAAVNTGCVSANNWDASIYRPRFVTVPQSWFNQDDAPTVMNEPDARGTGPGATNIGGATDWTSHWGHPCPQVPAATGLRAVVNNTGSVSMSWTKTGSDVWSYLYQCDASTTACATTSSCTSETGGFTKQFDGLWLTDDYVVHQPITSAAVNGHTFVWYICTSGASSGKGGPSAQVRAKVTMPPPAAPTGLQGTRSGTTVSLSWTGVTFPSPSVYYTPFFWDITAGGTAANAIAGAPVTATSLTMTVPNATHQYGFFVRASNIAGASGNSNTIIR